MKWKHHLIVAAGAILAGLAAGLVRGERGHPLVIEGARGLIWGLALFELCVAPMAWVRRKFGEASHTLPLLFAPAIAGLVGGAVATTVAVGLTNALTNSRLFYPLGLHEMLVIDTVLAMLAGLAFTLYTVVRSLHLHMRAGAATALQAQIQPHFFFNTLNTIATMIETRPAEARELVVKLSEQFRYSFACAQQPLVPLAREMEFVRRYLDIEQARLGGRLHVSLPHAVPGWTVPGLILQPLVENAVRHGVAPAVAGGAAEVRFEQDGRIVVRNTVESEPDLSPGNLYQSQHALGITKRRLEMMRGKLKVERDADGWVRAEITLPKEGRWRYSAS